MATYEPMPKAVLELANEVAMKYPSDIPLAVEEGLKMLRSLPEYKKLVDKLVDQCFRGLVYNARHNETVATKRQNGAYGGPTKQRPGDSEALGEVHRSLYDNWFVGSSRLGDLLGEQLEDLETVENGLANGHNINARLLAWLRRQGVPEGIKVRDAVPEDKTRAAFQRIKKEFAQDRRQRTSVNGAARKT